MEAGPDALLVIGTGHVHRLAGGDWTPLAALPAGVTRASAGRAEDRTFIYATTQRGEIQVSEDGGASWRVSQAAPSGRFQAIGASGRNGRVAYAGFRGMKLGEGAQGTFNGISKTTDGGRTWTVVHQESNQPAKNQTNSWIETRAMGGGRDVFFDTPWSVGVAPGDPDICYATDLFRTYRTLDGGKTWETVNSVRVGDDTWTTRGLDVTTNYGVHFDPFDARHLMISYTDIGAFQSRDGGASWSSATNGVPSNWRNTTYWVVFDPKVKGRVVGRVQRNARPAAPEDVAESRSKDVRGRRGDLRRRRADLAALEPGHAIDRGDSPGAGYGEPGRLSHAVRHCASDAVCTSPRTMENPGR